MLHPNRRKTFFILFISFVAYFVFWYFIGITNYYNASMDGVYDLGATMQRAYLVSYNFGFIFWIQNISASPISFIFTIIAFRGSIPIWIGMLDFMTGIPFVFIYLITKKLTGSIQLSIVLAILYLASYLLIGLNYVDFHYQALFIFFFLGGYYFFLTRRFKLSTVFFVISAMVKFEFAIFPALFSLLTIVEIVNSNKKQNKVLITSDTQYSFIVLIVSTIVLLFGLIYNNITHTVLGQTLHSYMTSVNSIENLLYTWFFFMLTFAFLPLFSRKWLPYSLLLIISSFLFGAGASYVYPGIIFFHHTSPWIVFLFLGTIDGVTYLFGICKNRKISRKPILRSITLLLAFITIITISVYNPVSPLNKDSNVNFGFTHFQLTPSKQFKEINELAKLIPNNSNVLLQDNMPSLLPRTFVGISSGIIPVAGHTLKPFRNESIRSNLFTVGSFNISIDFVLADYGSGTFTSNNTGFPSMSYIVNSFLSSDYYGVYAVDGYSFLLKRNYSYQPLIISPINMTINPRDYSYTGYILNNGTLFIPKNVTNTSIAVEVYFPIPGNYSSTIKLSEYKITKRAVISELLLPQNGSKILQLEKITIPAANYFNENITFNFNIVLPSNYWIKLFINNGRQNVFVSPMNIFMSN